MPAAPLSNTLDGPDATAITTGNSGGSLGDALSNVVAGSGVTLAYSTTQEAAGSVASAGFSHATISTVSYLEWTGLGSLTGDVWIRFYMYASGPVTTGQGTVRIAEFMTATPGTSARLMKTEAGVIALRNAAGSSFGTGGTVTMATAQWIRLEARIRSSTTAGEFEWWLFNDPDSTVADDTANSTGAVLGANTDAIRFGPTGSTSPFPSGSTGYYDEIAVSTTGPIGPSSTAPPPVWAPQPRRMPIA